MSSKAPKITKPVVESNPSTDEPLLNSGIVEEFHSAPASEIAIPADGAMNAINLAPTPDAAADAAVTHITEPPATTSSFERDTVEWMIAEAAYYKAERRDFEPGHEAEDWIAAENEVLSRLGVQ